MISIVSPTYLFRSFIAYHISLATCPHRKTSNFFSNQTILNVAENASCLHIVDFGTLYGFQWPSFLHKLSSRPGGPPRVRFTAINFPCPGFRPSQRIQETVRRLASYRGEVLVANCLYRLRYLLDETVLPNCPRDIVLNLIRKMNPAVFVLGIRNGGCNGPFFLTRFREALFDYSSIFDVLDATISRDMHERMLLERVVLGREVMNAIACEGAERMERPETYKQWQVRLGRAGLEVVPLNKEIMATTRSKVKLYHQDCVIHDDGYWLLQGWKGRISYALSCWRPAK